MATSKRHNVFVGSEIGLLKGVNTTHKYFQNLNDIGGLDRQNEILRMCWGNTEETEICCGLKNRTIKIYNVKNGAYNEAFTIEGGEGPLRGLAKYNGHFLTCVESGTVTISNGDNYQVETEFEVGNNISKMRQNLQRPSLIATGGKENDLKVWDVENVARPIFKAKNVPNDFLDHRVPVWVRDMQFFPNSERIVVCTGYHHIRVYDPKTPQKRPVITMEFDDYPLTALSLAHGQNLVIVGNSRGRMGLFDLRRKLLVHCFKGFAGSIRSVQCHPTLPLVASCGLDRFLRVHNVESRQLLHKVYLKSRLNCLLFSKADKCDITQEVNDGLTFNDNQEMVEELNDELWDRMDEVKDDKDAVLKPKPYTLKRARSRTNDSVNNKMKIRSLMNTTTKKKIGIDNA